MCSESPTNIGYNLVLNAMKTVQKNIRQEQKTNERFSVGQDYKQENAASKSSEYEGEYYDSISSSIETQSVQILPRQNIDKLEPIVRDVSTNNNEYEGGIDKIISNTQSRSLSTGMTVEDKDEPSQTQTTEQTRTPDTNTIDQYYDEGNLITHTNYHK